MMTMTINHFYIRHNKSLFTKLKLLLHKMTYHRAQAFLLHKKQFTNKKLELGLSCETRIFRITK